MTDDLPFTAPQHDFHADGYREPLPDVPPDFPQYRAAPIAACPECLGDCVDEGRDGFHCPACDHMWTYQQVAYFEGDDPRD